MTSIGYEDVVRWLRAFSAVVAEQKDALTELDSAIGDADHGINMHRGMTAVESVLDTQPPGDVGGLFRAVAMKLISTVGGASGPLYGTLFLQMGTTCTGKSELSPQDWATAMDAGLAGIIARGKAEVGDKTMVDAFTRGGGAAQ
ncbi:MAG: dihydroxyacetone kinase subunit DhaL [Thermoleophilia bacterium]